MHEIHQSRPGALIFTCPCMITHQSSITDPSSPGQEVTCVDVDTTPVRNQSLTSHLGYLQILFWVSVDLVILYWVMIGLAHISAAGSHGATKPDWSGIRRASTVLVSVISGERLSTHYTLLGFMTLSWRDVFFHTQWQVFILTHALNMLQYCDKVCVIDYGRCGVAHLYLWVLPYCSI